MSEIANENHLIDLSPVRDFGLIIIKAHFSKKIVRDKFEKVIRMNYPRPGGINLGKKLSVGWMSTDECALITSSAQVNTICQKIYQGLRGQSFVCVNMSDSRCCFKLQGKGWREVLAKGSPADVSKESFSLGVLRRTRIDNVAVAFWMVNLNDIRVMCMRSFGDFLEDWFENAARSSQSIDYF